MELEVKNLHKSFEEKEVLHGISFSTGSGKAFGLLGRNGAGKTTTLRIILDVFRPNQGEILLDGKQFKPSRFQIGYLPEERGLYPKKQIGEQLMYLAQLRGLKKQDAANNIDKWMRRMDIKGCESKKLESLSKGNQQKVQFIQALVCDPQILILDEPFSGLDPVNSQIFQEIIKEVIRENKLVIFSSHQMNYVENFCEEIAILKEGRIVLQGKLDDLKQRFGAGRLLVSSDNYTLGELEQICFEKLQDYVMVYDWKKEGIILQLLHDTTKNDLLNALMKCGVEIDGFGIYKPSLTDIFVLKAGD